MTSGKLCGLKLVTLVVGVCLLLAANATAKSVDQGSHRVLLAFLPNDPSLSDGQLNSAERRGTRGRSSISVLDRLSVFPQLSLGFTSATQGSYSPTQALLDMTQGTRTSASTYSPERVPRVRLDLKSPVPRISNWLAVRLRADSAPAKIVPGLLASKVPGGAAFAGGEGGTWLPSLVAAKRYYGFLSGASIGSNATVASRVEQLLKRYRFVVAELPGGEAGSQQVAQLIRERSKGELLIVMQRPPRSVDSQLLATGVVGLGARVPGQLTSTTTHRDGIIAGIDILPTVLDHLGIPVPKLVKGEPIEIVPGRDLKGLDRAQGRLRVVGPRRIPALQAMVMVWILVALGAAVFNRRKGWRWSGRVGALAFFWMPSVLLLTAAITPSRDNEIALIAIASFALAILTDLALRWPRAPFLPALVALIFYGVDLGAGSDLVVNSLLGPNPRSGSRFFGVGNELEALIPTLSLLGLAGVLDRTPRGRLSASAFALLGVVLAIIIGAGKFGADVGGVITIGAGAAVATALMLPGGLTRRRVAIVIAIPILGLILLALIDVVTGGNGHFTRTVLGAGGTADIWDIVARRYELAFNSFTRDLMPLFTAICVLLIVYAIQNRERFYVALEGRPGWRAALLGGLAATIVGTLFNDSGPVLLLYGTVLLLLATIYLRCPKT